MRVIGLISGTSMDGIDAAVADLELRDGEIELVPLGSTSVPYEPPLRDALAATLPPRISSAGEICRLDNEIGRAFAGAAVRALGEVAGGDADLVVSHGQTLFHQVEDGRVRGTLQIGQPAWIAETTGLPVVADLRPRDVAAGGQGAPMASMFDVLLLAGSQQPKAALNIGGIANLTIVSPDSEPIGFDTGPGNALIDAAIRHLTGGREELDRDGHMAGSGRVDGALLERLHADPYYRLPPPKTTGKEHFHLDYLMDAVSGGTEIAAEDLLATVTYLSAVTIAEACLAHQVSEVIVSGGGPSNPVLMGMLQGEMPNVAISPIDTLGIPSEAKEAYFFALLGFLTVHQLPGNVPSVTGAGRPVILGSLLPGRNGFPAVSSVSSRPTRLRIGEAT
ncbi:MAG: anhydro-N-acetylmuramic acid kinase [Acidimicrobiia bacterium]